MRLNLNTRTFKYKKSQKISELCTIAGILILIFFALDSESEVRGKILSVVILSGFLIFMIGYTYLLTENIEINEEELKINKKIGKSKRVRLNEIRRVTFREEANSIEIYQLAMTVFGNGKNLRIIVSDLEDESPMIDVIEEKGNQHGFRVIHQKINGQIRNVQK